MPAHKPTGSPRHLLGKGGIGSASRTTFLSVKKFRFARVRSGALILGTIAFLGLLVWAAFGFFR